MTHGPQGPHSREDQDTGCSFAEGNPCQYCPFIKCIDELTNGDRIKFGLAFKKEDARDWRHNLWQIQSALAEDKRLLALLQARWEPFAITPDGDRNRVWLKKNPVAAGGPRGNEDNGEDEA